MADLRRDMGYSQPQVADMLHVSKHTVAAWEQGKTTPPVAVLKQICELYDVSADYLIGLTTEPISYQAPSRTSRFNNEERHLMAEFEGYLLHRRKIK